MGIRESFRRANDTVRAAQQEAKEMEEMRREHERIAAEEAKRREASS